MKNKRSSKVTRKDFLRTAGSAALFASLGIVYPSCSSPTDSGPGNPPVTQPPPGSNAIVIDGNRITINLNHSSTQALRNAGSWMLITQASTLVVNVDGTIIRAFSSICTHEGCSTNWQFSNNVFECTCHGSRFNTSGAVVRGPATTNLPEYNVTRDGDTVVIQK